MNDCRNRLRYSPQLTFIFETLDDGKSSIKDVNHKMPKLGPKSRIHASRFGVLNKLFFRKVWKTSKE